jgi:CheY-like chemotaxis protein
MTARVRRIFVVDDHPDSAGTLADLLELLGHEVRYVTDARQALAEARRFKPDMALVDLAMPHLDGCALARLFRGDAALCGVCLVALTAFDDPKHRQMTREAGFDAHIKKPAEPALLKSIIAQFET